MCNPALIAMGVGAAFSAYGASNQAGQQRTSLLNEATNTDRQAVQADNQAKVAENNAKLAEYQAQDALRTGAIEESNSNVANAELKSRQQVAFAGNGIDVTTGSATDVLTGTDVVGKIDANTIRDNALRSAWGYRTQGTSYSDSAATAKADAALYRNDAVNIRNQAGAVSGKRAALASLLGGASQVATSWYGSRGGR